MRDRSCAAANVLAGLGVSRGETVALFTGTCPEWVYFWLGAARIGAVSAAVNAASRGDFLSHALNLSRAAVVITDADRRDRLDRGRRRRRHAEIDDGGGQFAHRCVGARLRHRARGRPRPRRATSARCSSHRARRDRRRPSPPHGTTCSPRRPPSPHRGNSGRVTCCGPPCRCSISARHPRCWRPCWSAGPVCWQRRSTRARCGMRYGPAAQRVSPARVRWCRCCGTCRPIRATPSWAFAFSRRHPSPPTCIATSRSATAAAS